MCWRRRARSCSRASARGHLPRFCSCGSCRCWSLPAHPSASRSASVCRAICRGVGPPRALARGVVPVIMNDTVSGPSAFVTRVTIRMYVLRGTRWERSHPLHSRPTDSAIRSRESCSPERPTTPIPAALHASTLARCWLLRAVAASARVATAARARRCDDRYRRHGHVQWWRTVVHSCWTLAFSPRRTLLS